MPDERIRVAIVPSDKAASHIFDNGLADICLNETKSLEHTIIYVPCPGTFAEMEMPELPNDPDLNLHEIVREPVGMAIFYSHISLEMLLEAISDEAGELDESDGKYVIIPA